jgi:hypothetical protein
MIREQPDCEKFRIEKAWLFAEMLSFILVVSV